MTSEERFMKRALELAALGVGQVSPNPMVGCVIEHQGQIIGEGYHQKYGEAHAEVNAINSVEQHKKLAESTVYVSLEPCSHFGKTPPCADLLVSKQVKKVVVCNLDPNPLVAGRGIKKLQEAGIEVSVGVLEEEGKLLNRAFLKSITQKRPYVVLKWAQTADGFIARKNYDSKWISNWLSRKLVHKWRAELDAIMVGTNTAKYDNPQLNVRSWSGKSPMRIVIDKHLKLNNELKLFDQSIPTVCYNFIKDESIENLSYVKLADAENILEQILAHLNELKIQTLFVEGGSQLLQSFIDQNLFDEARVFESGSFFGDGIAAPKLFSGIYERYELITDRLLIYRNS